MSPSWRPHFRVRCLGLEARGLRDATPEVLVVGHGRRNVVAKYLGHGSAKLVLDTYGHVMPGADDLTRAALESVWAPDRPAKSTSRAHR